MPRLVYSFKKFLDEHFPFEVRKLPIQTHLGCPHRDPETGTGGCIYCYEPAFSNLNTAQESIQQQIQKKLHTEKQKGYTGKFMAYFQTGTNTYADATQLEACYKTVESYDDIVALAVSTRPDCLSETILQILANQAKKQMLWLEIGLQSSHDKTLKRIHRGHDFHCFQQAIERIHAYPDIYICCHVILGLPGESRHEMQQTIQSVNEMKLHGIKFHHLQIVKHTLLEQQYNENQIQVFSKNDYLHLLAEMLTYLSPEIVVQRLFGETRLKYLIAPKWMTPKPKLIQELEKYMRSENIYQGKHFAI